MRRPLGHIEASRTANLRASGSVSYTHLNPIIRMNKGLGDYLSFRVPFAVKADCKDEVLELKEKIETLITVSKQPKS